MADEEIAPEELEGVPDDELEGEGGLEEDAVRVQSAPRTYACARIADKKNRAFRSLRSWRR